MKKISRSYISFSRTERAGIFGFCLVLIILIVVRMTMILWVHPRADTRVDKELLTAWDKIKINQTYVTNDSAQKNDGYKDALDDNSGALPELININTADSATLVRLKGIGPVTASKIIAKRKEIGPFTSTDQLLDIPRFRMATYDLLKKHLTVGTPAAE